ncbi:uncharacterized protein H6S33_000369 [Morchella sextelata]|uniref:uncharacterized protein n=1 Tax=Morchella sextelata TaxID=1174677 RepID=UPI001D03A4EB|nr:uncharacterized protein H6S33_000369 [Morchella sextelata]KAH0614733.1 hypothetical protein H6S33_000369 [Morchella sextelata]
MLISLTVGKVDAGLAILLTEEKRMIEFPSVLLPAGISSGSIVDIQVSRNHTAEAAQRDAFHSLQEEIYNLYGINSPSRPILRVRNATQTSVVLEWDPIQLATATLRSLTLYRNNSKAGSIPNPTTHTSTKISGLAVDTEYSFHLVLRTSAGTYSSEKLTVRTHKMTDLSGITVCPGIMPGEIREELEVVLARIGAKPLQDFVRIDTTHFVCTEGRGQPWERATEMNIPVVRPEWLLACEKDGRIVGVRQFYLSADISKMRQGLPMRERAQTGASVASSVNQQSQHRPTQSVSEIRSEAVVSPPPVETPAKSPSPPPVAENPRPEPEVKTPEPEAKVEEKSPDLEKVTSGDSGTPEVKAKVEEGFEDVSL